MNGLRSRPGREAHRVEPHKNFRMFVDMISVLNVSTTDLCTFELTLG